MGYTYLHIIVPYNAPVIIVQLSGFRPLDRGPINSVEVFSGIIVKNTTCLENMVYSAIETTCFGLYWPSSGFYNIKEESIKAVKKL